EDQRRDALPLAGGRPRGRSAGILCHEGKRQGRGAEIHQENNETPRPDGRHSHRRPALIRRRPEGDRRRRSPGNGTLVEQPRRGLKSTVSTTRASDEPFLEDENTPKIRLGSRIDPQPFQSGAPSRQPTNLPGETLRRPRSEEHTSELQSL